MGYETYRAEAFTRGTEYQNFVETVFRYYLEIELNCYKKKIEQYLIGENKAGIEIKNDRKFRERNPPALWIEYGEKAAPRDGAYAKSGILRHDNSWLLAIGDYQTLFLFGIKTLRRILIKNYETNHFEFVQTPTSQAFLMRLPEVQVIAEKILEIDRALLQERQYA